MLLVARDQKLLRAARKGVARKGLELLTASSWPGALAMLGQTNIYVVILDVSVPRLGSLSALKAIKAHFPMVEVILLIEPNTLTAAVQGLIYGAFDYVLKPATIEELNRVIQSALEKRLCLEEKIRKTQIRILHELYGT